MKIIRTASGKNMVKISKEEWVSIGKRASWLRVASVDKTLGVDVDGEVLEVDFSFEASYEPESGIHPDSRMPSSFDSDLTINSIDGYSLEEAIGKYDVNRILSAINEWIDEHGIDEMREAHEPDYESMLESDGYVDESRYDYF